MPHTYICKDCNNQMPRSADRCPHCARPGYYPNVRDAEDPEEMAALDERYNEAQLDATRRGAIDRLRDFEHAIDRSVAILARPANEILRLATSDDEIYASYYQLIGAGVRSYPDNKWSPLRAVADDALFPGYKENIRFAALSLDPLGLSNYGECSVVLKTDMIGHRASVFEENSTTFMEHHNVEMCKAHDLNKGYRATWLSRGKLCVAKLYGIIDAGTSVSQYSGILLSTGPTTGDDNFVEVHIWGPLTMRAFEQVTLTGGAKAYKRVMLKALKEMFENAKVSVRLEVR